MAEPETTVILAGVFIDGAGGPAQHDVAVLIQGGRIARVLPAASPDVPATPASRRIDARDGTVLPGLIDTHLHLTFNARSAATSPAVIEQLVTDDETQIAIRAVQAAQTCLGVGITTVRDCGAKGLATIRLRDLIASGFITGPRILACGMPITTTAGHCHWLGLQADNEQEVILATRRMVRERADFIKVMATGGGMTVDSNVYEAQYSVAELTAIAREAHRLGRRVAAHSHSASGHRNCLAAGIDMIEHCHWITPQGTRFEPDLMQQLIDAGVYIGATISAGRRPVSDDVTPFAQLPDSVQEWYTTIRRMRDMGAKIVNHSDAIAPITTYEDFPYGVVAAVCYGGYSPTEAIHAVTGLAAEAIGIDGDTGALTPGKAADVLIVDGDVSADIRAVCRTRHVLRDGVLVAGPNMVRTTRSAVSQRA